jgi:hypothetical protein
MQDIAVIALQDMMTGMRIGIDGEMIGIVETGIGIGIEIGMVDTVRVVEDTRLEVGKAEADQRQGYNLQAHQGRIVRKELRAEDMQDHRMPLHSRGTAIGTHFGPCSGRWTRTVSCWRNSKHGREVTCKLMDVQTRARFLSTNLARHL